MLKFDLPQNDARYSVWLGLHTLPELSDFAIENARPLSDHMANASEFMVFSPYGHGHRVTHTIPYSDLLAAFPDVDPETLYPLTHIEYHERLDMRTYQVSQQVEPILDTVMTVTEWIEIYSIDDRDVDDDYPSMTADAVISVRHMLTGESVSVPFSRLMDEFPGLDPARTKVMTGYQVDFEGPITQQALDAECAKRGWPYIAAPDGMPETPEEREQRLLKRSPDLKKDVPSPFVYTDRGHRLKLR